MSVYARGTNKGQPEKTPANSSGSAPAAVAPRGFSAQLRGAGLWDLVQMECLARSHLSVQVVGEGGVGYLYFDRGHIVHATTSHLTGEAAALEILAWTNGSFQTCDRPWPEHVTIGTSHEGLIMQAAQIRDESGSNLVAFPARGGPTAGDEAFEELELTEIEEEGEGEMRGTKMDELAPPPSAGTNGGRGDTGGDFAVVMRLGPNGTVTTNRGGSEALAETVAYAQRLLQLAGELLGFEEFSAVECGFVDGRCIIFSEGEGEMVALRPRPEANLQALRERLGL
ncbi:MAG TPA: DUF4388 domain-containing protein [Polyangia bacterium]